MGGMVHACVAMGRVRGCVAAYDVDSFSAAGGMVVGDKHCP